MKKIIILMVCLWGLGNTFTSAQTTEKEKFISSLMKQMTLDEKIGQLAQCTYRGNFTGPDGGNIPKEEYVRQGRIGSMLNVIGVKDIRRYQELALQFAFAHSFNFRTGCYPRLSYRISASACRGCKFRFWP